MSSQDAFENPFLARYGSRFAFIDGHCRYYASRDATQGVSSGQLSPAQAAQLADEIGWAKLEQYSAFADGTSCTDGGGSVVSAGTLAFYCDCACDDDAPTGLADAIAASGKWTKTLADQGAPLDGPVRVLALETGVPQDQAQPWLLSRDLAEFVSATTDPAFWTATGLLVEDSADAAALRQLRANAVDAFFHLSQPVYVWSGDLTAQLFIRDELPAQAEAAITAFDERTRAATAR